MQTARAQRENLTLSFIAALAIHTLLYFPWKHAYPRSMFCIIPPTLAVAVSSSFMVSYPVYENTCSVEFPARGVHAMNNVVLTKWRIALSIYNIGVLENR